MASRADRAARYPDINVRMSLVESDLDRLESEIDSRVDSVNSTLTKIQWLLVTTSVGFAVMILMLALNLAADAF